MHAEVPQHECRQVLAPIAEEQQLVEAEHFRRCQTQPRRVLPDPFENVLLRMVAQSKLDLLRLVRLRKVWEHRTELAHSQQAQDFLRGGRWKALDKARFDKLAKRRIPRGHLHVLERIDAKERPLAGDDAGKQALGGHRCRCKPLAPPPFFVGQKVAVKFLNMRHHLEEVAGVVMRRGRLQRRQQRPLPLSRQSHRQRTQSRLTPHVR